MSNDDKSPFDLGRPKRTTKGLDLDAIRRDIQRVSEETGLHVAMDTSETATEGAADEPPETPKPEAPEPQRAPRAQPKTEAPTVRRLRRQMDDEKRSGEIRISLTIDNLQLEDLKVYCAVNRITQRDAIGRALTEFLERAASDTSYRPRPRARTK